MRRAHVVHVIDKMINTCVQLEMMKTTNASITETKYIVNGFLSFNVEIFYLHTVNIFTVCPLKRFAWVFPFPIHNFFYLHMSSSGLFFTLTTRERRHDKKIEARNKEKYVVSNLSNICIQCYRINNSSKIKFLTMTVTKVIRKLFNRRKKNS